MITGLIAANARWFLIGGLVAGLAWPALAQALHPLIRPLVVISLYLAILRQPALSGLGTLPPAIARVLALQGLVPLIAALALLALGVGAHPLALGLILILCAAPITGAAPIAGMMGAPTAPALRQTVVGTALLPLTIVPVFLLVPALGDARTVALTALGLLGLIALAAGAAWATARALPAPKPQTLDAAQALVLGLVVVGIMGGAGQALRDDPAQVLGLLAAVSALTFGLQALVLRARRGQPDAVALAVATGNRNVALMLGALPPDLVAQILPVIGLYQIPMYLTPLVLPWMARRLSA